ncbi:MAG: hypothetical protein ACP5OA_01580, partial [Candidatus Woesearchaeota archaeon]
MRKSAKNETFRRTKSKTVITLIVLFVIISLSMALSSAAVFNVQTTICSPSWYCTAFSNGDCGSRTCIDTESCGTNKGMPTEYLGCTSKSSGGKSGNEGGNPEYITSPDTLIDTLPEGYFTVNTD